MAALMFQDRFVPLIRAGRKCHTIRRERKRPLRLGNRLSLRRWKGKPYRSKQETIGEAVVTEVASIAIDWPSAHPEIEVDGVRLSERERERLARLDGFESAAVMGRWHRAVNGLPFVGVLIRWQVLELSL
jgi:hypothetical protein